MKIYHTPKLYTSLPGYVAGITYTNKESININGKITGLNLGDNTGVPIRKLMKISMYYQMPQVLKRKIWPWLNKFMVIN